VIEYTKNKTSLTSRYDAKVGHLFVGAQDNGEGWWNWWIALAEQGICAGEHGILEQGGEPRLHLAKKRIEVACEIIARAIFGDLT
jgi:hypothetical protein